MRCILLRPLGSSTETLMQSRLEEELILLLQHVIIILSIMSPIDTEHRENKLLVGSTLNI